MINRKLKYLNTLVLLTFLVGQTQYAYTSYFCTLKQMPVKAPTVAVTSTTDETCGMCDECQGVIMPPQHGLPTIEGNCIKVVTTEKSVISNLAEWAKFNSHIISALYFIQSNGFSVQSGSQNVSLASQAQSPPLDLPTLNSNLRI